MGIGDKLRDNSYQPTGNVINLDGYSLAKSKKCPVPFTSDPFEYIEGYLQYSLRPFQREVVGDIFSVDEKGIPVYDVATLIVGMRCLGLGTEVLMYDGTLKKIEDIVVGELVMGPDSKPRKVLNTSKGTSRLYEIEQSCAMTYIVNESHILSLKKSKSVENYEVHGKSYNRYPNDPDIVNIPILDYIDKSKKWKYFFRGYKSDFIEFPYKDVSIDPYLLGLWLGDGSSHELAITNPDIEILDYIRSYCEKVGGRLKVVEYENSKASLYRICFRSENRSEWHGAKEDNPIWNEFKKLNLKLNKHIPQIYISNSKEIRLKLLAGILDSDGYYSRHGYELTLANERLAKEVKLLADTLGYRTYIRKKRTTCQVKGFLGTAWRLSIHGDVWEIPCLVERKKYKHTGKESNKENGLSSIKVKPIGKGKYAGITVDGDNLFCLADCTVTHNSGKSLINSVIASFLLHRLLSMDDPAKELGQVSHYKLSGSFIANSEQQSKQTAYASFENIISSSPWWVKYIGWLKEREIHEGRETLFVQTQRRIYFPEKNLEILSLHSNSQSLAGLTAFFVSFEEISRADIVSGSIQDHTEKRSAQAVYYTASRATKSLYPFSKIVVTTSPMYEDDFGMQLLYVSKDFKCGINKSIMDSLRLKYPNKASRMIAYNYTSFEANPRSDENPSGFNEESFQMEKISNPTAAMRDFWAIPPNALSPFFEYPEKIDSCIDSNQVPVALFENAYFEETYNTMDKFEVRRYVGKKIYPQKSDKMKRYIICCDQGEVKDSFVVAMGHGEEIMVDIPNAAGVVEKTKRYKIIIDLVEEWKPNKADRITVSFQNVEETIRTLGQNFLVTKCLFDQWNSVESIQRLFSEGLYTEKLGATMEMYETLKLLIYSGMVEFPNNQKLISEFRQLNRVRTGGGRERVDHPPSGGKDNADAVVRVVWSVYNDSINQGMKDNFILPIVQQFSTVRSAGVYLKGLQDDMISGYDSSIFGTVSPGGNDIFGKDFIVKGNVNPNVGR